MTVAQSPLSLETLLRLPPAVRARFLLQKASRNQAAQFAKKPWKTRLRLLFPEHFTRPFSPPHEHLFGWADAITLESAPAPFVAIWARGRGKSTSAESVTCDLGIRKARRYGLYVSGTQDKADKHVATISAMLQSKHVAHHAPAMSRPRIAKTGNRTWKRSMLITDGDFAVESIGLDKAIRGAKIDWVRPDWIVFDDIDERHDSELTTRKKISTITESILPAGSTNVAVLFVQNIIFQGSVAHRLSTHDSEFAADFMLNRIISGPFKSAENLTYERVLNEDDTYSYKVKPPTRSLWRGIGLDVIERELTLWGDKAFKREAQHEINAENEGALWSREDKHDKQGNRLSVGLNTTRVFTHPDLYRIVVAVDPHATIGQTGIIAVGAAKVKGKKHGYTLEDASSRYGAKPKEWASQTWATAIKLGAHAVVAEQNQGGEMVRTTLESVRPKGCLIPIVLVHASKGKLTRAEPVSAAFDDGRGHIVGYHSNLEDELVTWEPGNESPNRLDAMVWAYTELGVVGGRPARQIDMDAIRRGNTI